EPFGRVVALFRGRVIPGKLRLVEPLQLQPHRGDGCAGARAAGTRGEQQRHRAAQRQEPMGLLHLHSLVSSPRARTLAGRASVERDCKDVNRLRIAARCTPGDDQARRSPRTDGCHGMRNRSRRMTSRYMTIPITETTRIADQVTSNRRALAPATTTRPRVSVSPPKYSPTTAPIRLSVVAIFRPVRK